MVRDFLVFYIGLLLAVNILAYTFSDARAEYEGIKSWKEDLICFRVSITGKRGEPIRLKWKNFLTFDENNKMVFLADSIPSHILDSLDSLGYNEDNPLEVGMLKVSHHGSKKNTSDELLKVIKTNRYIISSNGRNLSKECLSRIIRLNPYAEICFNYYHLNRLYFTSQDKIDFPNFKIIDIEQGVK